MSESAIGKEQLLTNLRNSGSEFVEKLRPLDAAKFEEGRYENGWNARQILAHVAAIEWSYPKLIDLARDTQSAPPPRPSEAPPQRTAQGGINSYNDRMVERYADASVAELLDVFERNRAATIEAVEAADDDLFHVKIKSAGGIPGPLGTVMNYVAVLHVRTHLNDILGPAQ
jgi:hypothetical protein